MSSSIMYSYDTEWNQSYSATSLIFNKLAVNILVESGVQLYTAEYVARILCETMQADCNRYHTNAYHILSIFSFIERYKIKISNAQKIALLFHDAIYDMSVSTVEVNKSRSIKFMDALLGHHSDKYLASARRCIAATAFHCNSKNLETLLLYDVNKEAELVMDLDLCFFAFPYKLFHNMNIFLMREAKLSGVEFMKKRTKQVDILFGNRYSPFKTKQFAQFQEIAEFNERKLREEWE